MADFLVREQIDNFIDEATNGVPKYQIVQTVLSGWDNITDIFNVYLHWHKCPGIDFKRARDIVKLLVVDAGGFAALSPQLKTIACIFKLGTFAERVAHLGTAKNMDLMAAYAINTKICREVRLFNVDLLVRNELPDNHKDILGDARTAVLDYRFFGVEGTANNDLPGVLDYLWGTSSTIYNNVGLVNKDWSPQTMSLTDLCTTLNNIISKGDYFFKMPPGVKWLLV